jgi:replicative DNA helicase Mcm
MTRPEPELEAIEELEEDQNRRPSAGGRQRFGSLFSILIPLKKEDSSKIEIIRGLFSKQDLKEIRYFLKFHKARFGKESFSTTKDILENPEYDVLVPNTVNKGMRERINEFNIAIRLQAKENLFLEFSKEAEERMLKLMAPNIIGLTEVKKAALLQLFAKEKVHILLLGDPSTGKTVVLRSVSELAPISSFGLGSGASKAGLTVTFSGKEIIKGLLPLADKGIACIDELNLMKVTDTAGLLNAMEKGFITYDKGNNHLQLDTRVKVFASANPNGDKFIGQTIDMLRKQVPFEPALLSRFHLVFLVRRPTTTEFLKITDKIIKDGEHHIEEHDKRFVKEYIEYSLSREAVFDKKLSPRIQDFVEEIKKDEDKFLVEVSPRMVVGLINMAKASARMHLREKTDEKDVDEAISIFRAALYIKKDILEK